MAKKPFVHIGDIAKTVVARSTLSMAVKGWQSIDIASEDSLPSISLIEKKLVIQHHPSLTRSETSFNDNGVILKLEVFWTKNNSPCDDGRWYKMHGEMAESLLRIHGPR